MDPNHYNCLYSYQFSSLDNLHGLSWFVFLFELSFWFNSLTSGEVNADSMATTKFELYKFNGDNDFNMWRIKMKALLVHQG